MGIRKGGIKLFLDNFCNEEIERCDKKKARPPQANNFFAGKIVRASEDTIVIHNRTGSYHDYNMNFEEIKKLQEPLQDFFNKSVWMSSYYGQDFSKGFFIEQDKPEKANIFSIDCCSNNSNCNIF